MDRAYDRPGQLCAVKKEKDSNVSGQGWYQQTRNPTQGRTVREELGALHGVRKAIHVCPLSPVRRHQGIMNLHLFCRAEAGSQPRSKQRQGPQRPVSATSSQSSHGAVAKCGRIGALAGRCTELSTPRRYTDKWDGDQFKGSKVNELTVILAVSVLTPLAGLAFAYFTFRHAVGMTS